MTVVHFPLSSQSRVHPRRESASQPDLKSSANSSARSGAGSEPGATAAQQLWQPAMESISRLSDAVDEQKETIATFRAKTQLLEDELHALRASLAEYRKNLAAIPISGLRRKAQRLVRIMDAAEAGSAPLHAISERFTDLPKKGRMASS